VLNADWLVAVGQPTPDRQAALLVVQPDRHDDFARASAAVRAAGFTRLGWDDFREGRWPIAPRAYVDLLDGLVRRITTGQLSLVSGGPLQVDPLWMAAARHDRQVLVGVAPPGTWQVGMSAAMVFGGILRPGRILCATAGVRFYRSGGGEAAGAAEAELERILAQVPAPGPAVQAPVGSDALCHCLCPKHRDDGMFCTGAATDQVTVLSGFTGPQGVPVPMCGPCATWWRQQQRPDRVAR
jgi:hypothetical protein